MWLSLSHDAFILVMSGINRYNEEKKRVLVLESDDVILDGVIRKNLFWCGDIYGEMWKWEQDDGDIWAKGTTSIKAVRQRGIQSIRETRQGLVRVECPKRSMAT